MISNPVPPTVAILSNPKPISSKAYSTAVRWRRFPFSVRAIAAPKPPWVVPSPPIEIAHQSLSFYSTDRIPISLRLVQLQKKSLARRHRPENPSVLGPIGGAVWSLICLLEELHRSAVSVGDEAKRDRVFWDSTEPLVWIFLRVFSLSPIFSLRYSLAANFVERSVDRCVLEDASIAFDMDMEMFSPATEFRYQRRFSAVAGVVGDTEIGDFSCWGDIGILDDSEKEVLDVRLPCPLRRRFLYEAMIVREKEQNSLVLSNYAQFLFQVEKDLDRAEEYFKLAVTSEPTDGEAMNRYAKFLWKEQGDLTMAEEMFLEAIDADPTSSYHQSCYANFLLLTGGDETCFPLDNGSVAGAGG
ncbi:hypothetical protein HPP92_003883 [Vanilla planifolia]|uniref:Uncharacterized protein n=1 Tax=Vanilla planifolia TaxID=51239 RepID=A0A835S4H8_VANPL|nr:hypothetical protein HPP92_003883 [Vanilla planifolia]